MSADGKKKFLVLYLAPVAVLEEWSRTDPAARSAAEARMRADWDRWLGAHSGMMLSTEAAGPTRRVTAQGVAEVRTDLMLCAFVQAETHEEAARCFTDHPHLQIPGSSIELTEVRAM